MNESEVPVLPLLLGSLILVYFGIEVNRQRNKLRKLFNVFDRDESQIASLLETWVDAGELTAYKPAHHHG
ncbi:MAG: hypothetical protein P4L85_12185 [Paludisphaera borealis]|uniref:hypothetical protein n=1 Tax=Paludisphaera borealis TaxID=1387353 RepID=UPI00283D4A18|nr:hypothetical protein [Paludisphaera borealis]MDR3620102.1 hypothetical protein [Paludisphaera borealis]